jgi:hypothetical protein
MLAKESKQMLSVKLDSLGKAKCFAGFVMGT